MNRNEDVGGSEIEVASSPSQMLPADPGLAAVDDRLVDQARADGVALTGEGGLLTGHIQKSSRERWTWRSPITSAMNPTLSRAAVRETPATVATQRPSGPKSAMLV